MSAARSRAGSHTGHLPLWGAVPVVLVDEIEESPDESDLTQQVPEVVAHLSLVW
jgi:hypothetical protein